MKVTDVDEIIARVKAEHGQEPPQGGLEVVCLADVTPKRIDWLWENWIAIGKVSVLAGDGGKGKSTILCDWAARTTNGERWPDGADGIAAGGVSFLPLRMMSRTRWPRA